MDFNEYVNRGAKFFQEGKIAQALENFKAALKLQPDNADIRQMIEMMKKQIDLVSSKRQAAANEAKERASILESKKGITNIDKAIVEYTQTLELNPNDDSVKNILADAYYIRGLTFDSKGEYARAFEDYNEAIKNRPDYPLAIKRRGYASSEVGEYDLAIKDFEKMIQFEPEDAQWKKRLATAYRERGIAYGDKGDYTRAATDLEMCLMLNPDDSTAREFLKMAKAAMAKK